MSRSCVFRVTSGSADAPGLVGIRLYRQYEDIEGFPDGSSDKESACNAGDTGNVGLIPGLGRSPGGGNDNPLQYSSLKDRGARRAWLSTPVFLPVEFHGQRSLASYSLWSPKELDTTEQLTHTHTHTHTPRNQNGCMRG